MSDFEELRPRAFAVAYEMLGSVGEAQDVVQEAFLRMHRFLQSGERIESPQAYVSTVVTRLCIDQLRSARVRRESYVGEWLPEPLADSADDPSRYVEMADAVSLAFLVLLESLSPEQRAAFVLREVFGYPYPEIAAIIGKRQDNVRQLVGRARKLVEERRPRFEASREQREQLTERFLAATEQGELKALEELLARDVVLHGDGGGKVPALAHAIHGREKVARTLLAWVRAIMRWSGGIAFHRVDVNGQPGAMTFDPQGGLIGVLALDVADGHVQAVNSIVNPDKLRHLGPLTDTAGRA
jgi:RNA polymerase sigma-70 factor (TIGR02957 family)